MSLQLERVLPGDLITANFINNIVDEIKELQSRVTSLEGTTGPVTSSVIITELIPPSGTVRVGDVLQVIGQNFGFSVGAHRVYVDDIRVDAFEAGSSDQKLVFRIPTAILDVPQQGRPALLTVSNQSSTTQRTIFLQSSQTLSGAVDVIAQGVKVGTATTPTASAPFTLQFKLKSRANLTATFSLDVAISVGGVANAIWQNNSQLLDENNSAITSRQVQLAPSQERTIFLLINPVPPGTAAGTKFAVIVTANAGGLVGTSGEQSFTVGTEVVPPDNTIGVNFSQTSRVIPAGAPNSISATTIRLAKGAAAVIVFDATITIAGSYSVTPVLSSATQNWQALNNASTPTTLTITQQDLAGGGIAAKVLEFSVRPVPDPGITPSATGEVEFRVQRSGSASFRSHKMQLQLAT